MAARPETWGRFAFNIQITGTSTSLNQFFTALAKSLRLFNVQETDLAVTQGGTLQATLDGTSVLPEIIPTP